MFLGIPLDKDAYAFKSSPYEFAAAEIGMQVHSVNCSASKLRYGALDNPRKLLTLQGARRATEVFRCAVGQQGRSDSRPQTGRGGSTAGGGGRGRFSGGRGPQRPSGPPRRPNNNTNGPRQQNNRQQQQPNFGGPVMNRDIRCPEVRVLDNRKEAIGVMSTGEALDMAAEQDVDLIMLNADASPPLVRLVQLNKLKYEQSKAEKDQRKKQRESRQDLKELRFRPNTEEHDYHVRLKNAKKFISQGDKIKLTMRFKGREMEFKDIGREMFERFLTDLGPDVSVAQPTSMNGYNMTVIVTPTVKK